MKRHPRTLQTYLGNVCASLIRQGGAPTLSDDETEIATDHYQRSMPCSVAAVAIRAQRGLYKVVALTD
jgi:hypothetical protein